MIDTNIQLETPRLLLRPPRSEDFVGYTELYTDEQAARFIGYCKTRAEAWRKFLQMPGAWAVQGFAMFSVIEKASQHWLGICGPWHPVDWPGTEVGWAFRRACWGQGFATEAAIAAIDYAFERLCWGEVIHCIDPDNAPSQALARRLGSQVQRRTHMPAPFAEYVVDVWGQSREQWLARRRETATP